MTNYTYDSTIYSPHDPRSVEYYEWRILILAAIEQARLDVVAGVTDSGVGDGLKSSIRSDALAFFCDGRWHALLAFCGVETKGMASGVAYWIAAMGAWARNMPGCMPAATDCDAVVWAHESGLLGDDETWLEASAEREGVMEQASRYRVKLL